MDPIGIIEIILPLLFSVLKDFGVDVPTSIQNLAGPLEQVAETLIADVKAGLPPSAETVGILQEVTVALQDVQADTTLDPKYLQWAESLTTIAAAVITADTAAQQKVDPTTLKPEDPI